MSAQLFNNENQVDFLLMVWFLFLSINRRKLCLRLLMLMMAVCLLSVAIYTRCDCKRMRLLFYPNVLCPKQCLRLSAPSGRVLLSLLLLGLKTGCKKPRFFVCYCYVKLSVRISTIPNTITDDKIEPDYRFYSIW